MPTSRRGSGKGRRPLADRGGDLNQTVYRIVSRVPEGTVATYGQIAEIAGTGPRQVGRALRLLPPGIDCPWHRIVNASGEISLRSGSGASRQRSLLRSEGIRFRVGRVDLSVYRWEP